MKNKLKEMLSNVNILIESLYIRFHFRKKVKNNLKKLDADNDKQYFKDTKTYWRKYGVNITTDYHKWYSSCNGIKDVRYIPEDVFYSKIIPYYLKIDFVPAYKDKAMYKRLFSSTNQPITIALNMDGMFYDDQYDMITIDEAIKLCKKHEEVIIKPTLESGGGNEIKFISPSKMNTEEIKSFLFEYEKNYIIQEVLNQHNDLKIINPESINTIRTISFFHKGEVIVLHSILRMGVNGSRVDNGSSGGINCKILEDGSLGKIAYDEKGNTNERHPQGFIFAEGRVPNYYKVKEVVINEHKKLPYFRLISWDFSINEKGQPVMIEFNLRWQGSKLHQLNHGPLFGEMTDEVLDEVFSSGN